jgi:hypothetical protein
MDTPLDYFFGGILLHNSRKAAKNSNPFDTLFSVCNELFLPPTKIEATMVLLVISSLKSLDNHLLCSRDFSQTMGNISKAF